MRVAIVADWLTTLGGAERAIAEFLGVWPQSPIFTTVKGVIRKGPLRAADIHVTRLQRLFAILGKHQPLLPLMPRAVEEIDLRGFDVVLSSSHAVAKGIIPPSTATHVCYCHTPMRYAWEMERQYLEDFRVPRLLLRTARKQLEKLRRWDLSASRRVDVFIANSTETARRIERIYGRGAMVIPPPVDERFFHHPVVPAENRTGFLAVGRLVPYKRFDLLVEAANALQLPLTIVGVGQEEDRLRALAGPTVTFRGRVSDEELPGLYAQAKALLFAAHEDAGIVPMEAEAAGTPVIAYGKGGIIDTVIDGETGLFFPEQTLASLQDALKRFEEISFSPQVIREHAKQFSSEGFRTKILDVVTKAAHA